MKKSIIKYGLWASAGLIVTSQLFTNILIDDPNNYQLAEILGYATIVLSLGLIFFAVLEYKKTTGSVSFGNAFKIGIGITFLVSIAFAGYSMVYLKYLDPDYTENYYTYNVEQIQKTEIPEEEKVIKLAEIEAAMSMGDTMQAVVMFFTAFIIGFVITLLSALIHSRNRKKIFMN